MRNNAQQKIVSCYNQNIASMPWKEMPRNSGIKTGRWSVRFSSGVAAPRTKSSLWSKSSRNLGEYGKDLFACFVDLEIWKAVIGQSSSGINFGRFCRSMALMVNCYALLSHSTADRSVCVRVNGKQSKPFHVGVGLRQGCVLSPPPFSIRLPELDRQMQPSWWVCHDWKLQN